MEIAVQTGRISLFVPFLLGELPLLPLTSLQSNLCKYAKLILPPVAFAHNWQDLIKWPGTRHTLTLEN